LLGPCPECDVFSPEQTAEVIACLEDQIDYVRLLLRDITASTIRYRVGQPLETAPSSLHAQYNRILTLQQHSRDVKTQFRRLVRYMSIADRYLACAVCAIRKAIDEGKVP
jgi:hypothetical protein